MKGLFIKDLQLVLMNKRLLYILISLVMIFSTVGEAFSISFMSSFIIVFCAIIALSTVSYDSVENCNTFLMTLPISRKEYVIEKYLFVISSGGVGLLCSLIAKTINAMVYHVGALWEESFVVAFIGFCLMALMIPLELKFGVEGGRIITFAMITIGGVIGQLIVVIWTQMDNEIKEWFWMWLDKLEQLSKWALLGLGVGILVAVFAISIPISMHIMKKKEL